MKELNSVILEGELVENPKVVEGKPSFNIRSNGDLYLIVIKSNKQELPEIGRGIRVIGYLEHAEHGIQVVADHFEVKPRKAGIE